MKSFGQITHDALQRLWNEKKARHQATVGGFHTAAKATGAQGGVTITGSVVTLPTSQRQPAATVEAFGGPGASDFPRSVWPCGKLQHAAVESVLGRYAEAVIAPEAQGGAASKNTPKGVGYMDAATCSQGGQRTHLE